MFKRTAAADEYAVRGLTAADLDAVVAIDAAIEGRTRREYLERRLQSALREPKQHAQFGATDEQGLAGYLLARLVQGEFGRSEPSLRIEIVGVRPALHGRGIGRRLFDALTAWGRKHGAVEVRTAATWQRTDILGWLDDLGFQLAPTHVVECHVNGSPLYAERHGPLVSEIGEGPGNEIDFGRNEANDQERFARHGADIRAMTSADLDPVVRIDRDLTRQNRRDYFAARLAEAEQDKSIRASLVALCDGVVVGFVMARADLGDFGRAQPVAVLDTLGVDPAYAHRGIGHALLSQLFANLGALRVETVETAVPNRDLGLLGFMYSAGFTDAPRLVFSRRLES